MLDEPIVIKVINYSTWIYLFSSFVLITVYYFLGDSVVEKVRESIDGLSDKTDEQVREKVKKEFKTIFFISPLIVLFVVVKECAFIIKTLFKKCKNDFKKWFLN